MSWKTWSVVGLGVVLAVYWGGLMRKRSTPSDEYTKAAFTRPTMLSPSSSEFGISYGGVDALSDVPKVESNQKVAILVHLPPCSSQETEMIWIVPRLPDQGPEGFDWMDLSCEIRLVLSGARPPVLGDGRVVEAKFKLSPGQYTLRYYREIVYIDGEQGPPQIEFMGQGQLQVTPSKSTEPTFVPLEDPHRIQLYKPENE